MMVLSDSHDVAYGSAAKEAEQREPGESSKDLSFSPPNAQNSLLSLTINEIQLKSGRSLGSMNMDEFLANLWSVDEDNQIPPQANQPNNEPARNCGMINSSQCSLARQGSFSVPAPLCKKTVDEVWFEMQQDEPENPKPDNNIDDRHNPGPPHRQQTLGEMTLEDFLVKAGVVQEAPGGGSSIILQKMVAPIQVSANFDPNYGVGPVMALGFSAPQNVVNNSSSGSVFAAYQMFQQTSAKGEDVHGEMDMGAMPHNKRRIIDGPPEVVVERRQRRMIKNRESAARSRARKQAYTVELELELNQLKDENAKLKQVLEEIDRKRKEEIVRRKSSTRAQKKANKLRSIRRTTSLPW